MKAGELVLISGGINVKALEAYNVKRIRPDGEPFHPQGLGIGYIVTIEGKSIYHAGDIDLIPEMENLKEIDVALLPSGDTFTIDIDEASEAATMINPRVAIPVHLKSADPEAFKTRVENKSSTEVVILGVGDEYKME